MNRFKLAFTELFTESDEELSGDAEVIGALLLFIIGMLIMIIDTWA